MTKVTSKRTARPMSRFGTCLTVILAVACFSSIYLCSAIAEAQDTGAAAAVPAPDGNALAKSFGLSESAKPAREMIPGWRKPRKIIVVTENEPDVPGRIAWLQTVAPGVELVPVKNALDAMPLIADADAQLGGSCNKSIVKAGKALRWIHTSHAGMESCLSGDVPPDLLNGKIVLTNLKRVLGPAISEHAIALMLALTRGLDYYIRMDAAAHFDPSAVPQSRLIKVRGMTMLVVGLGGVGTDIAQLAHGLGMKVIATRNSSHDGPPFVDYVGLPNELPDLLGKADVVVLAVPLTPETVNLMNASAFSHMKKGALLINIARGEEVVTKDLIEALKSGQVGGAGLDVYEPSRLSDDNPLWRAPNVILTPHMASQAMGDGPGGEAAWAIARENLKRYVAGDKLYSVVDPRAGY